MLPGEPRARLRHTRKVAVDEASGVARDDHHRAVDDVLARRAPVHVACLVAADLLAKGPYERLGRIPRRATFCAQRLDVVVRRIALVGDRGRNMRRDELCP